MPNTGDDIVQDDIAPILLLSTYQYEDIPVVSAQGDVDLSTVTRLWEALELCASHAPPHAEETGSDARDNVASVRQIAVDLREVSFIDSAGLALLVQARKRFADTCRLILLIQRNSQPERVLKLGRFDTFLTVLYTLENLEAPGARS